MNGSNSTNSFLSFLALLVILFLIYSFGSSWVDSKTPATPEQYKQVNEISKKYPSLSYMVNQKLESKTLTAYDIDTFMDATDKISEAAKNASEAEKNKQQENKLSEIQSNLLKDYPQFKLKHPFLSKVISPGFYQKKPYLTLSINGAIISVLLGLFILGKPRGPLAEMVGDGWILPVFIAIISTIIFALIGFFFVFSIMQALPAGFVLACNGLT